MVSVEMTMGRSVLAGSATLALLALPVVILSTREALRAVPPSVREGSYALGATKWQTIWHQVLPIALPGILTGLILALSRAIGETAPLITVGAVAFLSFAPDSLSSPFTVLPIQIFNWVSRPQKAFLINAAAGIVVLLAMMLVLMAGNSHFHSLTPVSTGIMSIQSTGQGSTHKSQPVHSSAITVCICLAAPRMASIGQA